MTRKLQEDLGLSNSLRETTDEKSAQVENPLHMESECSGGATFFTRS